MTSWTEAHQASLSIGFSRQECWSGLPFPPPGDLSNPGTEPGSPMLQADFLPSEPPGKPIHICCMLNHSSPVWLFVTQWTVAHQAPLSMGFSRQEYWSGLPCPPPGDLPDPGTEPISLMALPLAGRFFTTSTYGKQYMYMYIYVYIYKGNKLLFHKLWLFKEDLYMLAFICG